MTLFDIVDQLKAAGYDSNSVNGMQIIVSSHFKLKYSEINFRSTMLACDILVVDGVIIKDRTWVLKGTRATVAEIQNLAAGCKL